jgi:hypothetical protein
MLLYWHISPEASKAVPCWILLIGNAMKSFLERLAGGRSSFRGLGMGETAALSLSKGMRSPASLKRDVNKSLKKQAREPRNERKGFMACASPNAAHFVLCAVSYYHLIAFRHICPRKRSAKKISISFATDESSRIHANHSAVGYGNNRNGIERKDSILGKGEAETRELSRALLIYDFCAVRRRKRKECFFKSICFL